MITKFFIKIIIILNQKRILPLSDKLFLKIQYYYRLNKKLNLNQPKTFNEKLQWLKLYDKNELYTKMVDKYECKEYVTNIIGKDYIIPTLGVYNSFEEINFKKLPNQFVIKCTHDSGGLVICKNKKELDINKSKKKINKSLKRNFYNYAKEWPYKNVKPRIITEKYMEDKNNNGLTDYKVMCFNGVPKMIFTCTERYDESGLKVTFFDNDWNKLPFERHYPASEKIIEKPHNLKKMLELSKKLSKNIPFVRIDWYEINNKLYFGELTFFPGAGYEEFTPEEWDYKLGDMIRLPDKGDKNE